MSNRKRTFILVVFIIVLLALPTTVLANKQLFKARLTTGAELHEVAGSQARGAMHLAMFPDGVMRFQMQVVGLSGPATGAHLHAPANESANAPVILTLCGNPAPSAIGGVCPFDVATNSMTVSGEIDSNLLYAWGLRAADLFAWLDDGLVYVNVHTALNPAGEVRGQLLRP